MCKPNRIFLFISGLAVHRVLLGDLHPVNSPPLTWISKTCNFSSLVESSEHEEKSTGVSGEVSSTQPCPAPGYTQPEEAKEDMDVTKQTKPEENDDLGPLPDNWEMAYTEKGEVYFIE